MVDERTYNDGVVDALKAYGNLCSTVGDCTNCPVGKQLGNDMTCAVFAKNFPEKFFSLATGNSGDNSYYNEYCRRFTCSNLTVEEVADNLCRKTLFEGDTSCEKTDCVNCWKANYLGDLEPKENVEKENLFIDAMDFI